VKRPWMALAGTLAVAAVVGATAAALIVLALAPGPDTGPSPTGSATGAPPSAEPAPTQREQVALDAARTMTTWDPARDHNRTAAEHRARHLMTDERANRVVAPERPATGAEWIEAADRGATSVPTVELNHATELTDTGGSVIATWTWDSPDGSDIPTEPGTQPRIYFFEFTGGNKIHDYTY
jgi:hypothetical protein